MEKKQIGRGDVRAAQHNNHSALEVMKPFIKFGVKALGTLATVLVHIVKHVPKPDNGEQKGSGKVIKIS